MAQLAKGQFSLRGSKSLRQQGSKQEVERSAQSEIQDAGKDGKASAPWGLLLLPSFQQAGKEEAIGGRGQRASEGLLGQLNQKNYFPTDEAKNILMAFS